MNNHQPYGIILLLLLIIMGSACTQMTETPEASPEPVIPDIRNVDAPTHLCSATTQIRLHTLVDQIEQTGIRGQWQLSPADDETILQSGAWDLATGDIFVTFPDNASLAAGDYDVYLSWQELVIGSHQFTVSDVQPEITELSVSVVPQHTPVTKFPEDTRHFYVNFAYVGGCEGAPYWIKVYTGETLVCRYSGMLTEGGGTGSQPCYLEEGTAFISGDYTAVFTLMGDEEQDLAFRIGEPDTPPAPMPTPVPPPIACGEVFSAAGITPEGDAYRPLSLFDWYTQAVYVGAECKNLAPYTEWTSQWYRDGEMVRSITQTWGGSGSGTIWDSFTGVPDAPFVFPGTYTTTLEIGATTTITTEFRVLAYIPQDSGNESDQ